MSTEPIHGRVLVVDADYDVLGALSRALRERGHHVVLAADGRTGLARAVEVAADVVLVDRDVPIVDVRTFVEVLRENPRTSGAATFVMGREDAGRLSALAARTEPIVKPFNANEVAARVDEVLRARLGPPREPELRGDLAQVALFDLLQVFAANRRTGRLEIAMPSASGVVWVHQGQIVDATFGAVAGEKALYRILANTHGRFVFVPGAEADRVRIDAPVDQLLMEGARQADEIARAREGLPPPGALISVSVAPHDVSPLAHEIVARLDEPRSTDELLDVLGAGDLAVLRALAELGERGALLVFDPRGGKTRLSSPEDAIALRTAAHRLRRPGLDGIIRIGVLAQRAAEISRFARSLSRVEEFVAAPIPPAAAGLGALGALGAMRLDGTDLELFAMPLDASFRPLFGPMLAPARVAILLSEDMPDEDVEPLLRELDVRLVRVPSGWERPSGAAATIRAALAQDGPRSPTPPRRP
jgi:CheY-like chemotaxis protein